MYACIQSGGRGEGLNRDMVAIFSGKRNIYNKVSAGKKAEKGAFSRGRTETGTGRPAERDGGNDPGTAEGGEDAEGEDGGRVMTDIEKADGRRGEARKREKVLWRKCTKSLRRLWGFPYTIWTIDTIQGIYSLEGSGLPPDPRRKRRVQDVLRKY